MEFDKFFSLWPIAPMGAEDPVDGEQQQQNNDGGNNQGDQQNSQQNNQQQNNAGDGEDEDDPYKGLSAKELKRKLADEASAREQAEKDAKKYKDAQDAEERKKNDDLTNAKKDIQDRDETITKLRGALAEQAILGGIRDDKRYEWHNPNLVVQQLDREKVKVDDNGKVTGLEKELARVVKDPSFINNGVNFLLAKDNTQENNNNNQNQNNGGGGNNQQQNNGGYFQGQSGFQPGQGGGGNGSGFSDSDLAKNYPALAEMVANK